MHVGRTKLFALAGAIAVALAGCSKNDGGNDYDRMMEQKQGAATSLAGSGAKTHEKQYTLGKAWVVELRGLTITDGLIQEVKKLGNVAELDMGRSTVTDDQLKLMHDLGLHTLLVKLDLSQTAVTDTGLGHLEGSIFLAELNLTGTKVTPAAAQRFKKTREADPKSRVKVTNVKL